MVPGLTGSARFRGPATELIPACRKTATNMKDMCRLALFAARRQPPDVNDRPSRLFSAQQEAIQRSLGWNWLLRLTVAEFGCRDAGRSMKCHPLEGVLRSLTPSFALRSGSTARTVGYSPGPCPRTPRSARSTTSAISED